MKGSGLNKHFDFDSLEYCQNLWHWANLKLICWFQSKGIRKGITMKFELSICVFNTIDNQFIVFYIGLEPSNIVSIACSFCRFFLQYHLQCWYWYLKYLSVKLLLSFAGTAGSVSYVFFVILKIRAEVQNEAFNALQASKDNYFRIPLFLILIICRIVESLIQNWPDINWRNFTCTPNVIINIVIIIRIRFRIRVINVI